MPRYFGFNRRIVAVDLPFVGAELKADVASAKAGASALLCRSTSTARSKRSQATLNDKSASPNLSFSGRYKRVRNSLIIQTFKHLCFHTHAHSFPASHLFSAI
jgi:hypothetical protein